jgi:hypothetical protein
VGGFCRSCRVLVRRAEYNYVEAECLGEVFLGKGWR